MFHLVRRLSLDRIHALAARDKETEKGQKIPLFYQYGRKKIDDDPQGRAGASTTDVKEK